MISLSYSRISLADIAQKLQLDSPEDAEFIVAKVAPGAHCTALAAGTALAAPLLQPSPGLGLTPGPQHHLSAALKPLRGLGIQLPPCRQAVGVGRDL